MAALPKALETAARGPRVADPPAAAHSGSPRRYPVLVGSAAERHLVGRARVHRNVGRPCPDRARRRRDARRQHTAHSNRHRPGAGVSCGAHCSRTCRAIRASSRSRSLAILAPRAYDSTLPSRARTYLRRRCIDRHRADLGLLFSADRPIRRRIHERACKATGIRSGGGTS
jgi:hypothetical protein